MQVVDCDRQGAAAQANPYRAPSVLTGAGGSAVAAVWPAGQHPIIATMSGVRFCETDLCDRSVDHHGGTNAANLWNLVDNNGSKHRD